MTQDEWERSYQRRAVEAFLEQLGGADALKALLNALVAGQSSSSAKDLMEALGVRAETAVRTRVSDLNQQLQIFDRSLEARRQRYRLAISNHPYRLVFTPDSPALRRFWAAHTHTGPSSVLCTMPIFLRHPVERLIVRQLDLNDEDQWQKGARMLLRKFGQRARRGEMNQPASLVNLLAERLNNGFEVRRPYVPVGEVRCASRLSRCFGELGSEAHLRLASDEFESRGNSTILLGNARTSPAIRTLQERVAFDFQIKKSFVQTSNREIFRDMLAPHGRLYAVVTRCVDTDGGVTTTIAANVSGAIQVLGDELTDNARLTAILNETGCESWGELGARFELLFEISLGARQEFLARSRLVAFRGFNADS